MIFTNLGRSAVKGLIIAAGGLILMGLLLIAFPEFFAFIAAALLFVVAGFLLHWAWRLSETTAKVEERFRNAQQKPASDDDNVIDV